MSGSQLDDDLAVLVPDRKHPHGEVTAHAQTVGEREHMVAQRADHLHRVGLTIRERPARVRAGRLHRPQVPVATGKPPPAHRRR